jgi:hypothetical protein
LVAAIFGPKEKASNFFFPFQTAAEMKSARPRAMPFAFLSSRSWEKVGG